MKHYLLIAVGLVFAVSFISCSGTSTGPEEYSPQSELKFINESIK